MSNHANLKSLKLEVITTIINLGFVFAVLLNLFYLYHFHHPLVTYFLFAPGDAFGDYFTIYYSTRSLDPYFFSQPGGVYFPFTYLLFFPITLFKKKFSVALYTTIFIGIFSFFNWFFCIKKEKLTHTSFFEKTTALRQFIAITFITYPALWAFISGNVESYLFLFLGFFIYFFVQKKYGLSAIFLSFAIAMKLYPIIFMILLLTEKRYKEIFFLLAFTLAISIIPLFMFHSGIIPSLKAFASNLAWFDSYFIKTIRGLTFSTSLFSFLRILSHAIHHADYQYLIPVSSTNMRLYFLLVMSLFTIITLHIFLIEKTLWKKVALLTIAVLLFPHIVFSYKLILLYLPFYLFMNAEDDLESSPKIQFIYMIIFGLLMIPKEYFGIGGQSLSTLLNPALMLTLMTIIMTRSWFANKKIESEPLKKAFITIN